LSLNDENDNLFGKRKVIFSESIETIMIIKAFAPVEQMLYISLVFQKVGFTDALNGAYWREWVNINLLLFWQYRFG
jgi:hypothetical protein